MENTTKYYISTGVSKSDQILWLVKSDTDSEIRINRRQRFASSSSEFTAEIGDAGIFSHTDAKKICSQSDTWLAYPVVYVDGKGNKTVSVKSLFSRHAKAWRGINRIKCRHHSKTDLHFIK